MPLVQTAVETQLKAVLDPPTPYATTDEAATALATAIIAIIKTGTVTTVVSGTTGTGVIT